MLKDKKVPTTSRHPLHKSKLFTKSEIATFDKFYLEHDLPFSQDTFYANVIIEKEKDLKILSDAKTDVQKGYIAPQGKLAIGTYNRKSKKAPKKKHMKKDGLEITPAEDNTTKSVVDSEPITVIKPEDDFTLSAFSPNRIPGEEYAHRGS